MWYGGMYGYELKLHPIMLMQDIAEEFYPSAMVAFWL
jgi:hypothetical protein